MKLKKAGILLLLLLLLVSLGYLLTRFETCPIIRAGEALRILLPSMSALSSTEKPSVEAIEKILQAEGFLVIPPHADPDTLPHADPDTLPLSLTVIDTGEDLSSVLVIDGEVVEWTSVEVLRIPRPWDRWSIAFRVAPFSEDLARVGGSFRFWTPSRRIGIQAIGDFPTAGPDILSRGELGLGISYRVTTSLQAEAGGMLLSRDGFGLSLESCRAGVSFRL